LRILAPLQLLHPIAADVAGEEVREGVAAVGEEADTTDAVGVEAEEHTERKVDGLEVLPLVRTHIVDAS